MNDHVDRRSVPRTRASTALSLLTLVFIFNAVDRQLVAVLAQPIKLDLHLSDSELGLLSGFMFAIFYTFCGIPIAWLSDRTHRVRLIAIAITLWSLCSAACGLATSFVQLALARVGVAVGEAGGSPPSYSLISDYFPAARRGMALAVFSVGVPIGMTLATAGGGWIAAHYGWRSCFYWACVPGVLAAALLLLVVDEPERGRLDATAARSTDAPPLLTTLNLYVRDPVLVWLTLAASLSVFATQGILAWMPSFLIRVKGMSLGQISIYYAAVSGGGMLVGTLVAGRLADLANASARYRAPLIPAAANMLAWPFVLMAVRTSTTWSESLLYLIVPMLALWTYLPVVLTLQQNSVPANQRATCSAVLLFSIGLIGIGGGATFVGIVSDQMRARFGNQSLHYAFVALVPVFLCAIAAHLVTAYLIYRRDRAVSVADAT